MENDDASNAEVGENGMDLPWSIGNARHPPGKVQPLRSLTQQVVQLLPDPLLIGAQSEKKSQPCL
jgi:hypothetical protein